MRATLAEKDRTILALRAQLDEAIRAQQEMTEKYGNQKAKERKKGGKYEGRTEGKRADRTLLETKKQKNKKTNKRDRQSDGLIV